ncbi:MAG: ABC transporter substrate-binding protein [Methanocorpusculum sp.]|nr:ABC transporter substrate-binding protein [Methanocorpusculum sp.]MDE2521677.1 ABC transporter substrate-binding protein [Methanocorpusculum sp.]MDE2524767.1 ABC transporter substrate-binding protein [Methanocorpusculum sp.]
MKFCGKILIALVVVVAFSGVAAAEEMRTFVDDVGREITLPAAVDAVSPSGPLAQIVLYSLDPDLFVSIASEFSDLQKKYIDPRLLTLPVTGQFYGSKASTMNPESIMAMDKELNIDVVLDIGEAKETMKPDLDDISRKTNVTFAFITQNTLDDIPGSYLKLGALLSREEQGQRLSNYTSSLLAEFDAGMTKIGDNKKSLIYVTAIDGNSVSMVGQGSYHAEVIDYVGNNVVPPTVASGGSGDGYTMEDILQMNPDFIIVSSTTDHAYYRKIMSDPMWQSLPAVKNGNVYEAPNGPYNWMGGPPSVQRLLSLIWLGNLMYPDVFDYSIDSRVKEFYSLFFHYELTDADLNELMIYAKPNVFPVPTTTQAPVPIIGVLAGVAAAVVFAGRRL